MKKVVVGIIMMVVILGSVSCSQTPEEKAKEEIKEGTKKIGAGMKKLGEDIEEAAEE